MKHCARGHLLPDECWCPDDDDEQPESEQDDCGEDDSGMGVG